MQPIFSVRKELLPAAQSICMKDRESIPPEGFAGPASGEGLTALWEKSAVPHRKNGNSTEGGGWRSPLHNPAGWRKKRPAGEKGKKPLTDGSTNASIRTSGSYI